MTTPKKPTATDAEIIRRATATPSGTASSRRRPTPAPRRASAPAKKKNGPWRRFFRGCLWTFAVIASVGLLAASFGGYIPPSSLKGICIMVMTLPAWMALAGLSTLLNIFWCRKALTLNVLVFIACAAAMWDFFPLNITTPSAKKYADCPKFTLLTYNITNLSDLTGVYDGDVNPILSYILRTNADVVALQEAPVLVADQKHHVTPEQIDSLHRSYPYIMMYGYSNMILSKYPVEAVHVGEPIERPKKRAKQGEIAVFRLNIEGTKVTLFDVHLQSYNLSLDDKSLYSDLTHLTQKDSVGVKEQIKDVKSQLLSKIQLAAEKRENDAHRLCNYIDHYGGPNVIVSGDFNDVPGCYTLHQLHDRRFEEVYPKVAFGPMVTFNANRFYFRIDHICYRGCLQPLYLSRGNSKISDHYPLLAIFAITPEKDK